MKQLIFFAVIITCLYSCSAPSAPADKIRTENLALAKKFLHAVETKDAVTMDSLLADNYKGFGPSYGDSVNKEEALKGFKYNSENLYESVKYTRFQNIAVTVEEGEEAEPGNWVSNWAEIAIKYKDGRGPVHAWVNAVYKIKNGKIVLSRTFYNEADVLRQLGYKFTPPSE
ncbi:nuclear transport factor 2 family protein [Flavihumibacter profundi]|uniref:nuclear transport factor 2 family protein n=1 Tax=Flavihumibacter profundi TaxID=2716883 RepID=UPI001CC64DD2|nr:nuclear transport factor 2 family protein [Flavihumibacter profundi]MBZ5856028.1 nuclear transport factor 2 family protein [Flavihumibacter profundi]